MGREESVGCRPLPPYGMGRPKPRKTKENHGKPLKTKENQWKTNGKPKNTTSTGGGGGAAPTHQPRKTIGKPLENQATNLETKPKQQIIVETMGKPTKTSKYQTKPMENQGKPLCLQAV